MFTFLLILTFAITIGLFGMALLWVIRPGGVPLLVSLAPRERSFRRARGILNGGDWKAAFAAAGQLRDPKQPDPPFEHRVTLFEGDCLYRAAEQALQNGKYAEALELMRGAGDRLGLPESEFDKRIVELLLAEIRRRMASSPAAHDVERLTHDVLRVSGSHPEASFWLGLHYLHLRQVEPAREAFQDALANPQSPDAALYLGAVQLRTGRKREAVRWLNQAAQLAPMCPVIQWQLGLAYLESGGDPASAVKALEKATAADGLAAYAAKPSTVWTMTLPPHSWLAALNRRAAVPCPLGMDQMEPAAAAARRALAAALDQSNRATDAASVYYQAFSAGDDSPEVRRGLGLSLARAGLYDDALPHLHAARAKEPTTSTIAYLALCTARASAATPDEHGQKLDDALALLTGTEVRGEAEWSRVARELFQEAVTLGRTLDREVVLELANIFSSVHAIDPLAIEAYDRLAGRGAVPAEVAATYARAAAERDARGSNDLKLLHQAFADRDGLRRLFAEQQWDFSAAERKYLTRWAAISPGRYPDAPGPIYAAVAERLLIDDSRQADAEGRLADAAAAIELAAQLGPHRALTLDRLAERAARAGNRVETLARLEAWAHHHPNDPRPLVRRALLEHQAGRSAVALEQLAEACGKAQGPARARLLLITARVALSAQQPEIAEELFEQARTLAPTESDPLLGLTALAWQRGDVDRVAELATMLERSRGGDPLRAMFAALALTLSGQESAAGLALTTAASDARLAPEAAHLKAMVLAWQNRDAEARRALEAADGASEPTRDLVAALNGQLAWRGGDFVTAWKAWDDVPPEKRAGWKLDGLYAAAAFLAGAAELTAGRAAEALALLRLAREAGFLHERLSALESIARQRSARTADTDAPDISIEQLRQFESTSAAAGLKPSQAAWLARGYRRHGVSADTFRLLDAVTDPDAHVLLQRGLAHLQQRQLEAAADAFAAAVRVAPDAPAPAYNLAFAKLSLGLLDSVAAELDRAAELHPAADAKRVLRLLRALLPGQPFDPLLDGLTAADEHRLLKRLQRLGRLDAAGPLVDRLAQLKPLSPIVAQARGELLVLWTKKQIERGDFAAALALERSEVDASRAEKNLLGVAALVLDEPAKAYRYFEVALPQKGDDARVRQNLALAATRQGDPAKARNHWRRCVALLASHWVVPPGDPTYLPQLEERLRARGGLSGEVSI